MIEQKLEKLIVDKFAAALQTANVSGIQILGAWQSTGVNDDVKAIEDHASRGYLSVKASPRYYAAYVAAEGEVSVRVELNMRAETDAHGVDYLAITDVLNSVMYTWQRDYAAGSTDFAIANEFDYTGFRLDGGDVGIDRSNCIFTWIQNLTLQGVFRN